MSEQCVELKKLLTEIPVFGYATHNELRQVYLRARPIILQIAAKSQNGAMQESLGISSVEIDNLISWSAKEKGKRGKEIFFVKAAEQLKEDVKSAMLLIGCKND